MSKYLKKISKNDVYTLRRVIVKDRGIKHGDK